MESVAALKAFRKPFCESALRGKHRAGASIARTLTQGSAPYRSLHPGLLCATPTGAWRMFGFRGAGLIGQRRHASTPFSSFGVSIFMDMENSQ